MPKSYDQEDTIHERPSKLRKICQSEEELTLKEQRKFDQQENSQTKYVHNYFDTLPDEMLMKIFRMVVPYHGKKDIKSLRVYRTPDADKKEWNIHKCDYCEYTIDGPTNTSHERKKITERMRSHIKMMHKVARIVYLQCPMRHACKPCKFESKDASSMRSHLRENHPSIKIRTPDRNYIVDVLGNVCNRFRRISGDGVFWRDGIHIDVSSSFGNGERFYRIIQSYLGEPAQDLSITGLDTGIADKIDKRQQAQGKFANKFFGISDSVDMRPDAINKVAMNAWEARSKFTIWITEKDIATLSYKCPNLTQLNFYAVQMRKWPTYHNTWDSLIKLSLRYTNSPDIFKDVQLHKVMPNLRDLRITENGCLPIIMPDMTHCEKLTLVELIGGGNQKFSLPLNWQYKMPFFSGFTTLTISMIEFVQGDDSDRLDTMEVLYAVRRQCVQCKIQYEFFQDMITICSGVL